MIYKLLQPSPRQQIVSPIIPGFGSALGIFVVNNITVSYIEQFPKTIKRIHMMVWLMAIFMLIENYQRRSPAVRVSSI